jgi:hypothetical protein
MKNSSGFSYTLSAFTIIALIAFLGGYYLAKAKPTEEGFASGASCNTCQKPKRKCGCPCKVCDKPKPSCECKPKCSGCGMKKPKCACGRADVMADTGPAHMNRAVPPAPCPVPDPTKYVLKSTVPPCPGLPDMSRYMLKTECPSQPDMSKYVLKSSVPKCPPCISTCSKPCKIGECPPCPRPRCPILNCPEPKPCPACPQVQVAPCPEPKVQCKAAYETTPKVRPMLASTSQFGL